jgi:Calx-beta domain
VRLEGNFIGTNITGSAGLGGASFIIGTSGLDPGAVIVGGSLPAQRNVISGPGSTGIAVTNRVGVQIIGNYIGTNAAGTAAIGGLGVGISGTPGAGAPGPFTIGGLTTTPGTGAGNVIAGNTTVGISVTSDAGISTGIGTIQGNILGLSANGLTALGGGGIVLRDNAFLARTTPTLAPVTIGGTSPSARNVISGNTGVAIRAAADGVTIQQNYIGTDITGTLARPNGGAIDIDGGAGLITGLLLGTQIIGGVGVGNLIAGNSGANAITLARTTATIRGNLIGTRADGVTPLPNTGGHGIDVVQAVAIIGGTAAGEGNTITGSGQHGVRVEHNATTNVGKASILGNSIYQNGPTTGNGGLGIKHIRTSGVQSFPVIASATAGGNVQGTLNSTANTTFRVEFFANAACDSSGFGEGQTFIGAQSVVTDGSGNASFNATFAPLPVGQIVVTSTATDPAGNTSEFSSCRSAAVAALPTLAINNVTLAEGNSGTTAFNFTVTLSAARATAVTVNYATSNGTATAGSDYAAVSGTLNFAPGVLTQPVTVNVNGDTTVEPDETFLVTLSGPVNATIANAQGAGTGTIVNDDAAVILPTLSINNVSQNEGNSGLTPFVFTVTLSTASASTVTVNYATSDGSANAGSDYNTTSGTLSFAPGVLTQAITVNVIGDSVIEGTESFVVTLSAPANATLAVTQGIGSILNDDTVPVAPLVSARTLGNAAMLAMSLLLLMFGGCAVRRQQTQSLSRNHKQIERIQPCL